MAKRGPKVKKGLDFYPKRVRLSADLRFLFIKFKAEGYWVYHNLLDEIYGQEGYYMPYSDESLLVIADSCRTDPEVVHAIIELCLERGLFDKDMFADHQILTSREIQEDWAHVVRERKEQNYNPDYILINLDKVFKNEDVVVKEEIAQDTISIKPDDNSNNRQDNLHSKEIANNSSDNSYRKEGRKYSKEGSIVRKEESSFDSVNLKSVQKDSMANDEEKEISQENKISCTDPPPDNEKTNLKADKAKKTHPLRETFIKDWEDWADSSYINEKEANVSLKSLLVKLEQNARKRNKNAGNSTVYSTMREQYMNIFSNWEKLPDWMRGHREIKFLNNNLATINHNLKNKISTGKGTVYQEGWSTQNKKPIGS